MRFAIAVGVASVFVAIAPSLAYAQRFPFERSFDVTGPSKLDVSTVRGKIEIVAGETGRIVVAGDATVRVGLTVPANAIELAQQVAKAPPIERAGETIRLRPPPDATTQRAVIVSYRVQVPRNTEVRTSSDSGATTVQGVEGVVDVRTQSAAIDLSSLGGAATVLTGSGAVRIRGVAGALNVTTASSGFTGTDLGAPLRVRTQSGEIDATLNGAGNVDVETGSSAIRLQRVRGGLAVRTQSGRVSVDGVPAAEWTITTGSSAVTADIGAGTGFLIDASSRSGSVAVEGAPVQGTRREARGTVAGGGPVVRITTGSGAIRINVR